MFGNCIKKFKCWEQATMVPREILLPSAVHLEERLTVSESVS